ncbi:DEAD/DEAH box helicase family protein [Micromonospora palomenae]|uniref:DEAD/DEAH box helicase family protein n=1 Tax=Micromonospora palomenae TaxID=1461247 RepID=UPI003F8C81E6
MVTLAEALRDVDPCYEVPDDDLVGEVLVPGMKAATDVRIGAGFFTSGCLAQVAPGLAAYISRDDNTMLRLLISPELSEEDRVAIEHAVRTPSEVINEAMARLFEDAALSPTRIEQHAVDCLAYLLAARRLEVRFCLMRRGQYHKKIWLMSDDQGRLAVHGSGNATARGLFVNGEQMTIDRTWCDGERSVERVKTYLKRWEQQWDNHHPHSLTVTAEQALAVLARLGGRLDGTTSRVPTVADFWAAWRADLDAGRAPRLPPNVEIPQLHPQLSVPTWLNWQTGRYAHQKRAVDAFTAANRRGILAIATGGGKTKSSLVAATIAQNERQGPMLIVILVPSKPLMNQWAAEVAEFGLVPTLPSLLSGAARGDRFQQMRAALSLGAPRTEVMVVSNALFTSDNALRTFIDELAESVLTMIIGDEAHNLGTPAFLANPPERFDIRLGLSATPVRQYDPDGTDALFGFFGPQVFEFSLEEAIDSECLVKYDYYLHEVALTESEFQLYEDLTAKIIALGFMARDKGESGSDNKTYETLLFRRRSVLENAVGKLSLLRSLLATDPDSVRRTLIYASGKKPPFDSYERQIEQVNQMLTELGIVSHQFTSEETSTGQGRDILRIFGEGGYKVLTAMKVLDEGVDIPQTDTAYLLASSTVEREWVQRRGRILRSAPEKSRAVLHDFLVVPPDPHSPSGRRILRGEIARAEEFASLAENEWAPDGPRRTMARYE